MLVPFEYTLIYFLFTILNLLQKENSGCLLKALKGSKRKVVLAHKKFPIYFSRWY